MTVTAANASTSTVSTQRQEVHLQLCTTFILACRYQYQRTDPCRLHTAGSRLSVSMAVSAASVTTATPVAPRQLLLPPSPRAVTILDPVAPTPTLLSHHAAARTGSKSSRVRAAVSSGLCVNHVVSHAGHSPRSAPMVVPLILAIAQQKRRPRAKTTRPRGDNDDVVANGPEHALRSLHVTLRQRPRALQCR